MKVGFPHPPQEVGGPGSFQIRLARYLEDRGCEVVHSADSTWPDVVLVVGGTSRLDWLWRCRRRGIPIVHRLGPRNWRHRFPALGRARPVMSRARNLLLSTIRDRFADRVVYQSRFSMEWWHRDRGPAACPEVIIHNGVDLEMFDPASRRGARDLAARPLLVCLEGEIPSDPAAVAILRAVSLDLIPSGVIGEARIYGRILPEDRSALDPESRLVFERAVAREEVPEVLAEADVYLSLDVNGACPNAVIESLAAGVPVVGFASGALGELVTDGAGAVLPYGGDPWRLDLPATDALGPAIQGILDRLPEFRRNARRVAEERYDMNSIGDAYVAVMEEALGDV